MVTSADVERIFRDVGALREGHFLLSSGKHSSMYLEKFWVLQWPKKTELLCGGIVERIRDERIATVAGPTTGGIILAHEVARQLGVRAVYAEREERGSARVFRRGFQIARDERVLVVDDIMTTGGSVQETIDAVRTSGGEVIAAAVIVDRSGGVAEIGVPLHALWSLDIPTYAAQECPLCDRGIALVKPGTTPAPAVAR
ncbi:MAG: orotate phosphoribosyltransferase [Chloroflexi bacterium]|nr:MAG: orotate phosphoribosyltransferase [Chloroflexota bacterium]